MRKPTPELVIAVLALFVALAGTANAVVEAAVPLARRALVAENAKKLNGQKARAIARIPGTCKHGRRRRHDQEQGDPDLARPWKLLHDRLQSEREGHRRRVRLECRGP